MVISGSGNVAQFALQKATELGATVISVSDSNGYVIDENGIELRPFVRMLKTTVVLV